MTNLPDDPLAGQPRASVDAPLALAKPYAREDVPVIHVPEPPPSILALMAELGMPADALPWLDQIKSVGWTFGEEWASCWVEMTGLRLDPSTVPDPCPWPFYRLRLDDDTEAVVQLWQRRIMCSGTGAYVDARWHPDRGESVALRGLENVPRLADAERALRGLKLLRATDHRGRKRNSGRYRSEAEFREEQDAALKAFRLDGLRPKNAQQLADKMGVGRTLLFDCWRSWPDLRPRGL